MEPSFSIATPCTHQRCMSRYNALSTGRMGGCRRAKELSLRDVIPHPQSHRVALLGVLSEIELMLVLTIEYPPQPPPKLF